jgi:flagellar basal body-associated protein FliL
LKNPKGKRNKAIIAVLLPAIIFLWIVGWSLYWIGHQKETQKPQPPQSAKEKDHISIEAIAFEEPLETSS